VRPAYKRTGERTRAIEALCSSKLMSSARPACVRGALPSSTNILSLRWPLMDRFTTLAHVGARVMSWNVRRMAFRRDLLGDARDCSEAEKVPRTDGNSNPDLRMGLHRGSGRCASSTRSAERAVALRFASCVGEYPALGEACVSTLHHAAPVIGEHCRELGGEGRCGALPVFVVFRIAPRTLGAADAPHSELFGSSRSLVCRRPR
jgi:hypothetical protein